jgi:hypothetical protein
VSSNRHLDVPTQRTVSRAHLIEQGSNLTGCDLSMVENRGQNSRVDIWVVFCACAKIYGSSGRSQAGNIWLIIGSGGEAKGELSTLRLGTAGAMSQGGLEQTPEGRGPSAGRPRGHAGLILEDEGCDDLGVGQISASRE